MGGARMLRAQIGHDSLGAGAVRHRLHARDEAALLDDEFVVDGSGDRLRHGREAETGWHQRRRIVSYRNGTARLSFLVCERLNRSKYKKGVTITRNAFFATAKFW
jgi:hypothetical protein